MSKIPTICMIPSGYKAGKVYSVLPTNGDADLTFTRASEATRVDETGVIETMATGVPRLDYSDSGCPSLLVEPQSTNLYLNSSFQNITETAYVEKVFSNVLNEDNKALKLITDEVTNRNFLQTTYSFTVGVTYTYSVSIEEFTGADTAIGYLWTNFYPSTNQEYSYDKGKTWNSNFEFTFDRTAKNIWIRFTITGTSGFIRFGLGSPLSLPNRTITFSTPQLEALPYATSYIPTVASTVTRVAETVSKTGLSSYINSQEGVLYLNIKLSKILQTKRISISDGTPNNRILFQSSSFNDCRFYIVSSGVTVLDTNVINLPTLTRNDFNKIVFSYKNNSFKVYINGIEVYSNSVITFSFSSLLSRLAFDGSNSTDLPFYGEVKELKVFNRALTDAELIALTSN